jgi:hypothetical protein
MAIESKTREWSVVNHPELLSPTRLHLPQNHLYFPKAALKLWGTHAVPTVATLILSALGDL